jgi:cystathionine beta-lyase
MVFDFDTPVSRRGTDSVKWDVGENELPMWVADMDFKTAPAVEKAVLERAAHGVFGYTTFPEKWYDAYIGWWRDRHGFEMKKEWLHFAVGVIPAVSCAVRALSEKGDKVAILTPNYGSFFGLIEGNGRVTAEVPMIADRENGRMSYRIDWDLLEKTLADPETKLMIFCSPQNPTGKIWEAETMAQIGALCRRYGVTVLSDEIHSDIVSPGKRCLPFAAVNEGNLSVTATFISPTKSFNIMSLRTAAVCAADPELRKKIFSALGDLAGTNAFSAPAAIAAFTEGGEWLDALNVYIRGNKDRTEEFIRSELPMLETMPSEATYLMWIRTDAVSEDSEKFHAFLRKEAGLYVCPGTWYRGDGIRYIRFNTACPRLLLEAGLERLREGVHKYAAR